MVELAWRRSGLVELAWRRSGLRFYSSWGLRNFPTLMIRRKTSFSLSKLSSKFTILLILLRHLANISRHIILSTLLIIAECRTCVKNGLSRGLAHRRVAVIQVVQYLSSESEAQRFDFLWVPRIFFCPKHLTRRNKHLSKKNYLSWVKFLEFSPCRHVD